MLMDRVCISPFECKRNLHEREKSPWLKETLEEEIQNASPECGQNPPFKPR